MRKEERKLRKSKQFRWVPGTVGKYNFAYCFACRSFSVGMVYFFLTVFTLTNAFSQSLVDFSYKTYGLENHEANVIQNASYLTDFFENLYQVKVNADRKINIVHIGDSHVQADYITNMVRRNFHNHFGNAGRGLIVPARVAGSNEAANILTSSTVRWTAKRCVYPVQPLPIGIGGITISTNQPQAKLNIYMNDLWHDYSFNTISLFYEKNFSSFHFSIRDTTLTELANMNAFSRDTFENYSRVVLPQTLGAIYLETVQAQPSQNHATIFGLNLENGKNGILYHAIGVNGAKYEHYNAAPLFAKQTAALKPDVFVISLGTNEAISYPYLDRNFLQHVHTLVSSLQAVNPVAKFIFVTPPDAFRRKSKINPGISTIRNQIIQYAVENGYAFWDMYKAMGGENSADAWKRAALLRPDGVHFTRDGYEYQGNLFYHALIKAYNQYVPLRHP